MVALGGVARTNGGPAEGAAGAAGVGALDDFELLAVGWGGGIVEETESASNRSLSVLTPAIGERGGDSGGPDMSNLLASPFPPTRVRSPSCPARPHAVLLVRPSVLQR